MLPKARKLTASFNVQTREGDAAVAVEARNTEMLTRRATDVKAR